MDHCNERYSMVLYALVDVLRRCDVDYARAHKLPPTTDREWDAAIDAGEGMLDELSTDPEQADMFGRGNTSERRYKKFKGDSIMKGFNGY